MRILSVILLMCFGLPNVIGQYFLAFRSDYNDSFREWEVVIEKDSLELFGELELTWAIGNDFTQWRYNVDDYSGDIVQKFNNNPGFWELRAAEKVVSIRQVWPGDPNQWKISFEDRSFEFRTLYHNQLDEWVVSNDKFGELVIYTNQVGDPRDWLIEDYMSDFITFEERLAALFIALYTSIPKY